jgi:hypothetical protein
MDTQEGKGHHILCHWGTPLGHRVCRPTLKGQLLIPILPRGPVRLVQAVSQPAVTTLGTHPTLYLPDSLE